MSILLYATIAGFIWGGALMYLSCPNNNTGNKLMTVFGTGIWLWLVGSITLGYLYGFGMGLGILVLFPGAMVLSPVFVLPWDKPIATFVD